MKATKYILLASMNLYLKMKALMHSIIIEMQRAKTMLII